MDESGGINRGICKTHLKALTSPSLNPHPRIIPINGIKPRGENDNIQLMHRPILRLDPILNKLHNGRLLQIHNIDIVLIKLLIIPRITQRPAGVKILRRQLPRLLRIFDDLGDLLADEFTCLLVRRLVVCNVAKRVEHEAEPVAFVPCILVDALAFLGADVECLRRRFCEAEGYDRTAHLVPNLVVSVVDALSVLRINGPVAAGDAVLWGALEANKAFDLLGFA